MYLNAKVFFSLNLLIFNLTLTRVVFEWRAELVKLLLLIIYLTLTRVVFELKELKDMGKTDKI